MFLKWIFSLVRGLCLLNEMYCLQEKESVITELRKELRLSNEEHRDLLSKVNADETIRQIRWFT